jgi:hypothetical protein
MGISSFSQIKGFVPGCGGQTRVWKIMNNLFDRRFLPEAEISRAENAYRFFEQELTQILFEFPDPFVLNEQFQSHEKRFRTAIQRLRPALLEEEKPRLSSKTRSSRRTTKQPRASVASKSLIHFKAPATRENVVGSRL